jgi:hypothetical protein
MVEQRWHNQRLAFWLAPLLSTAPLIPFFSLPSSPFFLGRLMDDPTHPFLWPGFGPWLAAMAVIFDGTLLGYFALLLAAVPLYQLLKMTGRLSVMRVLLVFSLSGVLASQFVHLMQHFHQPTLRAFADSWLPALFGCMAGLLSGASFAVSANRRFSPAGRALAYSLPPAVLVACGGAVVWSASVWKIR